MFQRITLARGVLNSGGPVFRNVNGFLVQRNNSTVTATEAVSDEWDNAKPYGDLPGPKPLPVIGNIWRFLPHIGDLTDDFSKMQNIFHQRYGIIAKLAGLPGRKDMVFVYDPNEIEKVFRHEGPWPIRDTLQSLKYYREKTRRDIFEGIGGAVVNQGEEWQKFRSKVNPTMMQPRATKIYVAPIDEVANDFVKRIRILRDEKQEMPENFNNELHKWALESIAYITLDARIGCLDTDLQPDSEPQKMIDSVQAMFDSFYKMDVKPSLWRLYSTPAWKSFVKASDFFTEVALKYIDQAKKRLENLPKDTDRELTVLEKLLARDSDTKTAMVMALDMLFAGIDTTAYTTASLLYNLAKNPDKQQKLFEEIQTHLPDKDQPITSATLNELKYLKACMKESMRLRPIAIGNVRRLVKDMVLSNYRIPKGTDIAMPNLYLCTMEKYFPQADKYIPERWLKSKDGSQMDLKMTHPFVYMPFGFGPRMCLGRRFAELEMETVITKIIRNFKLEYNYGEMEYKTGLLYVPASPLKFKIVDRT